MTTKEMTAATGFNSWLAFYEFLISIGKEKEERISVAHNQKAATVSDCNVRKDVSESDTDVVFYSFEIRANAFDEIYRHLPARKNIVELLSAMGEYFPGQAVRHFNFVHFIPIKNA